MRRRCRWKVATPADEKGPPVWLRGDIALWECPKPFITPESDALVQQFLLRRSLGRTNFAELSARQADAFAILEREFRREREHGQQNARRDPEAL